jgi:adenylate kinase family enzyme
VIGTSASGKSTFSAVLAERIAVPRVELDPLYWGRDWTPKPKQEFLKLIDEATTTERWVVDGNYGSAREHLWPKANVIIWLNYGMATVLWRGLKRTVARALSRQELWHGNRESFRKAFLSRESILVWIVTTHQRRRRELASLKQSGVYGLPWIKFTKPRQAQEWLARQQVT